MGQLQRHEQKGHRESTEASRIRNPPQNDGHGSSAPEFSRTTIMPEAACLLDEGAALARRGRA